MRRALRAFQIAENFITVSDVNIDCLPRSLALHRFLASCDVPAQHCIGVRRYPFGAHAWVEVNGVPVCDTATFVEQFSVLARL